MADTMVDLMADPMVAAEIEFAYRDAYQRTRAVEKYGAVAALPGGHPEYDVLDYAINEIAGLPRYLEMITERLREAGALTRDRTLLLQMITNQTALWGEHLIQMRHEVLAEGVALGTPEFPTA